MAKEKKDFLVSVCDFALYYNDILACIGRTNLNTSINVSMQEQNINAGKGNGLLYSYKYGREMSVTLEAADWKLEYIAANVGSKITEGLTDVFKCGECVNLTEGIGIVSAVPVGDVAVENIGKTGHVQIVVPSYQPSGNFTMNFTPDGASSTSIEGKALSVSGDRCSDGSAVYAYIYEFDDTESAMSVSDIAISDGDITLKVGDTSTLSVIGLKGELYSPIKLENEDIAFVSATPATVSESDVVTAVAADTSKITAKYKNFTDEITVTVAAD